MQGKGIVKFFLVVMLLVTIFQYFFIIPTNTVENEAADYAEETTGDTEGEEFRTARAFYLDSISDKEVFKIPLLKSYTYNDLKSQQLALGLDLKGGMSVVLQVDLREFIRTMARNSKDPKFEEALENASQAQANAQDDFVTLFADAWNDVADGARLAPIFARNDALAQEIDQNTSDATVISVLREKADETVELTYKLMSRRIDALGVVQPNISLDAERDLILVELPGIENAARARQVLTAAANLEFFDVLPVDNNMFTALVSADQLLERRSEIAAGRDSNYVEEVTFRYDTIYGTDDLGNLTNEIDRIDTSEVQNQTAGPIFSILQPNQGGFGPAVLGIASKGNIDQVLEYLNDAEVKRLFPRNAAFRFGSEALPGAEEGTTSDFYQLYVVDMPRNGEAPLTGEYVTRADAGPQPDGQIAVNLSMNSEGGQIWARMTTEAANAGNRQVAIALDDRIVSAPRVNGPITGGNTAITGGFNVEEARDLANILQVGRLPARTEIIQESIVGPSLGADNIRSSMIALAIGFVLVLAFMILYYGSAGIVSIISLLLNLVFIFGALAGFGTVLTLPGIAGILLTIGMAVDANVIIYERIREELRVGKTLVTAIEDGYSNSYSAIIDANVTTLLVAGVLGYFGVGPIKGFAVVLGIGVISSMFTAVLVNRLFIEWWVEKYGNITFWTDWSKNLFADINIDWMGKRKMTYAISGVLVALSIAAILVRGFDLSVDFQGGYSYTVQFADEVDAQDLREALTGPFDGVPTVKAVDTDNTYNIVTKYLVNETAQIDGQEPQDVVMAALLEGVQTATGDAALTIDQFQNTEAGVGTHITSVSKVGPTIADDIKASAYWAGGFGLLFIGLYLLLRFSKFRYSLGAVAALFHDSIIVMGVFAAFWGILPFNMEVDQAFIAAILTVIGYSINDTVIVFDRIREFLNTYVSRDKTTVINDAINSTVSRTVITSLTTALVVLVLLLFGGSSIKGFAFALLVGIIVGTYSSIFVATPVVHDLMDEKEAREAATAETKEPTMV